MPADVPRPRPGRARTITDDSLLQEFLTEAFESLDRADAELVALEARPGDREVLASAFRSIHSIKGACGFLEFARLERVAHVGENLLSSLRDGHLDLDGEVSGALLELIDAVRSMLRVIQETGAEGPEEHSALRERLARLNAPAVRAKPAPEPIHETDPAVLAEFANFTFEPAANAAPAPASASAGATNGAAPAESKAPAAAPAPAVPSPARAERATPADVLLGRTAKASAGVAARASGGGGSHGGSDGGLASFDPSDATAPAGPTAAQLLDAPDVVAPDASAPARSPRLENSNIRVSVEHLDRLMNMVGELVLARNQLLQGASRLADAATDTAVHRVNIITTELQESVMKMRMQPIGNLWSKFPRVVRDVARACGKDVELEMHGKETELDKTLLEAISDPLTHLLRNAIDHGIESPERRAECGKPPVGRVGLRSYHESGHVVVEIVDDGKGLDLERIKEKAVQRRLVTPAKAATMTDRDAAQLIFHPGLSTAEKVSNISGRGVGMDVVKTNIERIGGFVDVSSEVGRGTTVRIKIPLTLAIIPALLVTVDGDRYAIP